MDDGYKIKPLHIMLPKTSTHVKNFDRETKWMYFLIEDDIFLQKYDIWNKVSHSIKKEFGRKLIYNEKILKTK